MDINPFDAIVVGSGATGGVAALTLAEQGMRVLGIDAGPQIYRWEASSKEPKGTLNRLSGIFSKKHANQSQHPGYWKNNPNLYSNELIILIANQKTSHSFGLKESNMGEDH